MTRLKEAFTRLRIPPFPVQVVDPMQVCLQLTAALDRLEVLNGTVASLPRSPLDATEVWDKWVLLLFDLTKLSRLEFRTLCQSPATAMNPVFVSALARNPTGLERLPSLCAFVQSYFSKWRNMVQPDQVENIIQGLLEHMAGKSTVIAKWRDLPGLVSATADHALAHAIVRAQSSMNVLKRYNVGATTGCGDGGPAEGD